MPRKAAKTKTPFLETSAAEITEIKQTETVKVTIKRGHCITPHSIELRKDVKGLVTDARTEDHRHIETIGAKTVGQIFADAGQEIPADDKTELEIVISPHNGEIIAIQPKTLEIPEENEPATGGENQDNGNTQDALASLADEEKESD